MPDPVQDPTQITVDPEAWKRVQFGSMLPGLAGQLPPPPVPPPIPAGLQQGGTPSMEEMLMHLPRGGPSPTGGIDARYYPVNQMLLQLIQPGGEGAVAVRPETVPRFTKALEEAETMGYGGTGDPLVNKALAWLWTRYPRFSHQVPTYASPLEPNTYGQFVSGDLGQYAELNPQFMRQEAEQNRLVQELAEELKRALKLQTPVIAGAAGATDPLARAIETLAHEMTHARQFTKMGPENMYEESRAGVPYRDRLIEQRARAAGTTARESYLKYLQYLAGK